MQLCLFWRPGVNQTFYSEQDKDKIGGKVSLENQHGYFVFASPVTVPDNNFKNNVWSAAKRAGESYAQYPQ